MEGFHAYRATCHDSTERHMIVTLLVCHGTAERAQGSQHADVEGGGGVDDRGAAEAPRSQHLLGRKAREADTLVEGRKRKSETSGFVIRSVDGT
jgi:hypothetical protein